MAEAAARPAAAGGGFAPFRHAAFAVLWTATVLSNTGTWMHEVGAGWLMATATDSALLVALVQTANTLPVFLLALPAGALADLVDKRRLLVAAQAAMVAVTATMAFVVTLGGMTPYLLLGFTLLIGIGTALTQPAWQSIVPKLVPRPELQSAIALNSVGVNVSRAIGPAAAGFLIAWLGIAAPFWINAASFAIVVAALAWWRQPALPPATLPSERFMSAIRTGLRYTRESPPMRATLVRAVAFFLFASAYWAMLPLVARHALAGDAALYGILLGCVGAGAVGGAMALPPLKARLGPDRLVAAGTLGTALVLLALAAAPSSAVAAGACLVAGASWIAVLSSLHVSAQTALPDWVRGRGLSVFVTVFFGAMSGGSLVWGQVADAASVPAALVAAAAGALVTIPLTWRWKLQVGAALDLAPSMHWPAPQLAHDVDHDRGPVMVTIEYQIEPARAAGFLAALRDLARERRRDGAFAWGVFEDVAAPGRYVEYFMVESWAEHLRQHARVTNADRVLQDAVAAYHVADRPPQPRHLLAPAHDAGGA